MFRIPFIELPLYSYGVMLGLSLVVGWFLVMKLGGDDGLPRDKMGTCFVWTAVAAILGARVLYILTNLGEYESSSLLDMINLRKGGLVAYGGFLGGFIGSWIYLKTQKIRLLAWADVVVPTLATGLGITRLGCLMFGCDYGKPIPADAPEWIKALGLRFPNWEVAFPELTSMFKEGVGFMTGIFYGAPAYHHHVDLGIAAAGDASSALVYPTQLMASANGWFAFALVMLVRRHIAFRGQVFLVFTAYYGVTRALMELVRGDVGRGGVGVFSTSQLVGLLTLAGSMIAYGVLAWRAKKHPESAMFMGDGAAPTPEDTPNPVKTGRQKNTPRKRK